MKLQPAPREYHQGQEQEMRNQIERADGESHKKGRHLDLGGADYYPILYDTVTGDRYKLTVASGVLAVTAL